MGKDRQERRGGREEEQNSDAKAITHRFPQADYLSDSHVATAIFKTNFPSHLTLILLPSFIQYIDTILCTNPKHSTT